MSSSMRHVALDCISTANCTIYSEIKVFQWVKKRIFEYDVF